MDRRRQRLWSVDGDPPAPDAPPPMTSGERGRLKTKLQRDLQRLVKLDEWALAPVDELQVDQRNRLRSRITEIQQELEMAAQRTPRKGKKDAASEAVRRRTPADVLADNGRSIPTVQPKPRAETLENAITVNRDGQPIIKAPDTVDPITGLTLQQMLFIEELIITPDDAAAAAVRAGYEKTKSGAVAARLLQEEFVLKRLHARRMELITSRGMTADRLVAELAKIVDANLLDVLTADIEIPGRYFLKPLTDLTPAQRASIASLTELKDGRISVKMINKIDAINAAARILGHDKGGAGRAAPGAEEAGPTGGGKGAPTEVKVNISFVTPPTGGMVPVADAEIVEGS